MSLPTTGGFTVPAGRSAPGSTLASPWERLAAHFIDRFILGSVTGVLTLPIWSMATWDSEQREAELKRRAAAGEDLSFTEIIGEKVIVAVVVVLLISALCFMVYEIFMTTQKEATVGKRVMRLRIVRAEDGLPPGGGRMLARSGVGALFGAVSCVALLDVLSILGPRRLTLHDIVGRTVVVKLPPPVPPAYYPYR